MDGEELIAQLKGRASFCFDRGEKKSPELMIKAAEYIDLILYMNASLASAVEHLDKVKDRITTERDEAWKRAEHAEKMWGSTEVTLTEAINILEDALQEAGDDYPGSTMQSWCQQQIKQARKVRGK